MNNTMKALYLYEIYYLIKPFSELGTQAKKEFELFQTGSEERARDYYQKLNSLLNMLKEAPEQVNHFGSILNHFEDIRSSILSGNNRAYEMHELFRIKHFIYFYKNLCNHLTSKGLSCNFETYKENSQYIIPSRNFDSLFDLLDFDRQNSPTFYLSNHYSEKFRELKEDLVKTQSYQTRIWDNFVSKIVSELNLEKFEETAVVSRINHELILKLVESKYFFISDENFANTTLKVKKEEEFLFIEEKINQIKQDLEIEAQNIRNMLTEKILLSKDKLLKAIDEVGYFDLLLAKADFGRVYGCVIPEIKNNTLKFTSESKGKKSDKKGEVGICFDGQNTFNIFLVSELNKLNIGYQKIDIKINNKVNIITGSNMGGKTSILKTIGQLAMMLKLGLPLPAEKISLMLFDKIFFCGPTSNEERADLSSFGIEVITLQNVIETKGQNLFLLDEFGRGTNPSEGQALFNGVMQYFTTHTETVVISATHYNPPQNLTNCTHYQMIGLQEGFSEEIKANENMGLTDKLKLIKKYMNYQPVEVTENTEIPKTALNIAELLGLEKEIILGVYNL